MLCIEYHSRILFYSVKFMKGMSYLQEQNAKINGKNVPWYAYLVLFLVIIIFSGIFTNKINPLGALDFDNLLGNFGSMGNAEAESGVKFARDFKGIGGSGAREAFLLALFVAPAIIVAFGIIEICVDYKGLLAAEVLFTPIMKPLMGLPGAAAVSLVSSFTSSDAGASTIKSLREDGFINERQRVIFSSFQLMAPSILINFFLLISIVAAYISKPTSIALLVIIVMKFVGANVSRLLVRFMYKETKEEA